MSRISNLIFGSAIFLPFLFSCSRKTLPAGASTILPVDPYAQAIQSDPTACLIDVRTPEEYAEGHIDGAKLLNVMDSTAFAVSVDRLSPDSTYYIYCRSGRRSQKAAALMVKRGLKVVDLKGGFNAWKERRPSEP